MRQLNRAGRVICFDLFGTLVRSRYEGPKYYELLERRPPGFTSEYVAAAIRGHAMNWSALNWTFQGRKLWDDDPVDDGQEYMDIIRQRLGNAFDANPNAHYTGEPREPREVEAIDRDTLVECWKAENDSIAWITGAKRALTDASAAGILILATNITLAGMSAVYERLPDLPGFFKQCYWSCELPVAKPDPYIWQLIRQEHTAEEYWMVGDDELIDLAMPRAMGWKTLLVGPNGNDLNTAIHRILEEK